MISVDGTKIRPNASPGANRTYEKLFADTSREAGAGAVQLAAPGALPDLRAA